jgi:hypothetical protein
MGTIAPSLPVEIAFLHVGKCMAPRPVGSVGAVLAHAGKEGAKEDAPMIYQNTNDISHRSATKINFQISLLTDS